MKRKLLAAALIAGSINIWAGPKPLTVADSVGPEAIPLVGNGLLGFIPGTDGLTTQRTYSASVHNRGSETSVSKIRPVMSPFNFHIIPQAEAAALRPVSRTLDMERGAFTTILESPEMRLTATQRALRGLPCMSMLTVDVEALKSVDVAFVNTPAIASADSLASYAKRVRAERNYYNIRRNDLRYSGGRDVVASTTVLVCGEGCEAQGADTVVVKLPAGRTASFEALTSICSSTDYSDPWQESERQVLFAIREGSDRLVGRHEALWRELWKSDVTVEGNPELQLAVSTALYHLYSSIREGSRRSIAPVGQSGQGYNGHIFWDADTWMLPVMAVLHPELARSMVDFRVDGLEAARRRARGMGYLGAMYPWEADLNGEESTPTTALTGTMEQHITADVANGAWQYYCVSGDKEWLRESGYPMMKEIADFWLSRVEPNDDGTYSIRNVVGADEYAVAVDDNAFTNGAVKAALLHTIAAAEELDLSPDLRWAEVAGKLKFHYFPDGVMREYDGYEGAKIKQSDVTLLGYPLGVVQDRDQLLRDIAYYDTKLDPDHGPAMSHGVMAVTLSRQGRAEEAARALATAYRPNVRGPFMVLAETARNNRTYFLTGAGAMLQGIIFGLAGVDINDSGIVQVESTLPAGVESVTVTTPSGEFTRRRH